MTLISYSLVAVAVLFALPVTLFVVEVAAAVALFHRGSVVPKSDRRSRQRIAVLVPAHNESGGLLPTLADIKSQMHSSDRLVVVADNCSDDTAAVATKAGAEVVERDDRSRRGKGYALACGLDYLGADRTDIVIVIDADCRVADHTIERLALACGATQRPVQALDLMSAPPDSSINLKVAEFAWRVKNWVRPLGLSALGLPCQLMGTGMAFPWNLIHSAPLASGSIVEDLKLGHDLAGAGYPPLFCPSARVTSLFPSSDAAVQTQRLRWEQGHIRLIVETVPGLFCKAIKGANWSLLVLALDLSVPPLSLLAILAIAALVISGIAAVLGFSSTAMVISVISLLGLAIGVLLSWLNFGRDVLPPRAIWSTVPYAFGKVAFYSRILCGKPGPEWIRTDRRRR